MVASRYVDTGHQRGTLTAAGLLLGIGLGGFVDGIVFHQLLQWHHMLSATLEPGTVPDLQRNVFWDGLFHTVSWVAVLIGVALLARVISLGAWWPRRALWGLILAGWGVFNLVEGIVDHHLLGIHHVRDDVADPLPWDVAFLVFGALVLVVGAAVARRPLREPRP